MSWDVRTNIKAKPGSQGTLFQGGSDQMTDAKWPRHYTPERLHEVRQAVAPGQKVFRDLFRYQTPVGTAGEQRKLIDNIARSTVPGEHLNGLQFSPGRLPDEMSHGSGDAQMTADGIYSRPRVQTGPALIRMRKGMADSPVAIHEIGHHADYLAGADRPSTRTDLGHSEGQADAYADTHFRDRRGRPDKSFEGYRYMQPDSVRNDEFFTAYHSTRPRQRELAPYRPDPHLPGLDAVSLFVAGRGTRKKTT